MTAIFGTSAIKEHKPVMDLGLVADQGHVHTDGLCSPTNTDMHFVSMFQVGPKIVCDELLENGVCKIKGTECGDGRRNLIAL